MQRIWMGDGKLSFIQISNYTKLRLFLMFAVLEIAKLGGSSAFALPVPSPTSRVAYTVTPPPTSTATVKAIASVATSNTPEKTATPEPTPTSTGTPTPTATPTPLLCCVGGYKLGDHPGSGCCYEVTPQNGASCTCSSSFKTSTIVCSGGSNPGTSTFTTKVESGNGGPKTWQCGTTAKVT